MSVNRTSIPTLFLSCLTLAGCGSKSPTTASGGSEPRFYSRGRLADAGSEVYRRERPDFATEIPKLVLQYEQSIGDDARELEAIGLLHDIAADAGVESRVNELKKLIGPLCKSLRSQNPEIRRMSSLTLDYVTKNLGAEGYAAIGPLMDLIQREATMPDQDASTFAISAIGHVGPSASEAVPLLIDQLANATAPRHFCAAEALGRIQSEPELTAPALLRALEPRSDFGETIMGHSEFEVLYEHAAIGLGCFGADAASAAPRLIRLAETRKHGHHRQAFLRAICRIGTQRERAIPVLVKVIDEAKQRESTLDDDTLTYAIDALCSYGAEGEQAAIQALRGTRFLIVMNHASRLWESMDPCASLVNQNAVVEVVGKVDTLEILELIGEFDDAALQSLVNATNLKQLYLPTKSTLGNQDYLGELKNLELLRCGEKPSVEALVKVAELPSLATLIIPNSKLRAAELSALPMMPSLKSLDIHGLDCADDGLEQLSKFPSLQQLRLFSPRNLNDPDLKHLRQLSDLRELTFVATSVGDPGMQHVKHLTQLRRLALYSTNVSDAGLMQLVTLEHLERLECGGSRITRHQASDFQRRMPNLESVTFGQ